MSFHGGLLRACHPCMACLATGMRECSKPDACLGKPSMLGWHHVHAHSHKAGSKHAQVLTHLFSSLSRQRSSVPTFCLPLTILRSMASLSCLLSVCSLRHMSRTSLSVLGAISSLADSDAFSSASLETSCRRACRSSVLPTVESELDLHQQLQLQRDLAAGTKYNKAWEGQLPIRS